MSETCSCAACVHVGSNGCCPSCGKTRESRAALVWPGFAARLNRERRLTFALWSAAACFVALISVVFLVGMIEKYLGQLDWPLHKLGTVVVAGLFGVPAIVLGGIALFRVRGARSTVSPERAVASILAGVLVLGEGVWLSACVLPSVQKVTDRMHG